MKPIKNNNPMSNEGKNAIISMAEAMLERKKLSGAEAARQMGMSHPTFSQMLNRKWELVSDQMWQRVANWCGYLGNTEWPVLETMQYNTVTNLLLDAQENCRMLALCANTGLGKSTSIRLYCKETPNTYKVLCTVTMSRKDFLAEIQKALGIDLSGSIHARIESIIEKLGSMKWPLLILDDAGKLNESCLKLVQVIYDSLEFRCGIVLAGTTQLKKFILSGASKDKQGFRELKRRIGYWERLMPPDIHAIRGFCEAFSITEANAISFVHRQCKDFGTLREMLTNAKRLADKNGCSIDLSILESVNVGDRYENAR
jgi:DNA transposition AAA+ family ATPase